MAGGIIKDGTGSGSTAEVDSTNRLRTRAVSDTSTIEALQDGRSFFLGTGIVALTTDCASQLLHLQNCDCRDILLTQVIITFGESKNCACVILTGDYKSTLHVNATAGTLICCGACGFVINNNVGSGLTACVIAKVGSEGSTIVGIAATDLHPEAKRIILTNLAIIPKGGSVSFGVIPPTGNASMDAQLGIAFHFIEVT